jgi:hypothetical protein
MTAVVLSRVLRAGRPAVNKLSETENAGWGRLERRIGLIASGAGSEVMNENEERLVRRGRYARLPC